MISKELVGTSERLEQIKNKLSSSAACSVLHVSNLNRCLEEFDEITKNCRDVFCIFTVKMETHNYLYFWLIFIERCGWVVVPI